MPEKSKQERAMESWRRLTPEQRDYDRFIAGQIPFGASWVPETEWGWEDGLARRDEMITGQCGGCSCHINPPCSHCEHNHRNHDEHASDEQWEAWELAVVEEEAYVEAAERAAKAGA